MAVGFVPALVTIVTAHPLVPKRVQAKSQRVPATARDQRLIGVVGFFGIAAVGLFALNVQTTNWLLTLASAGCLIVSVATYLNARWLDRRDKGVRSGWQELRR